MKSMIGALELFAVEYVHSYTLEEKRLIRNIAYDFIFTEFKDGRPRLMYLKYFGDSIERKRMQHENKL